MSSNTPESLGKRIFKNPLTYIALLVATGLISGYLMWRDIAYKNTPWVSDIQCSDNFVTQQGKILLNREQREFIFSLLLHKNRSDIYGTRVAVYGKGLNPIAEQRLLDESMDPSDPTEPPLLNPQDLLLEAITFEPDQQGLLRPVYNGEFSPETYDSKNFIRGSLFSGKTNLVNFKYYYRDPKMYNVALVFGNGFCDQILPASDN